MRGDRGGVSHGEYIARKRGKKRGVGRKKDHKNVCKKSEKRGRNA